MVIHHRLRLWLGGVALAILVAAAFAGVHDHAFLLFDDADYVVENESVRRGLTWEGVRWAFVSSHAGNWHPVTWLSHMADVEAFGMHAGAHALVNAGLHLATSLLVFHFFFRRTARMGPAFLVAALFAVHPLHVESVAWVAERKDVLCAFFWMLTLASYARYVDAPSRARYATVMLCFALAVMSKPMAVTLPGVLLLLDVWPFRRVAGTHAPADARPHTIDARGSLSLGQLFREKVPLFGIAIVAAGITYLAQSASGAVQSAEAFPWALRLANVPVAYLTYVVKTMWPANLAVLYPYPASIPFWESAGAAAVLIALTGGAVLARRRRPWVTAGWLWFLVTLVPVIGIVQVGSQPRADRYMYLPAIGLFVIVAWGLAELASASRARGRAAAAVAAAVLAVLTLLSSRQTEAWRDSIALWQHAVAVTQGNFRAHTNLGFALAEAGQPDRAIAEYRTAIAIEPGYANARNYLGALLSERGDHAQAAAELRAALASRPRFVEAHNNLGLALAGLGHAGDAIGAFREAVRLNPAFAPAWNNLGIALADAGQIDGAIDAFRTSVGLQPDSAEAHFNLGTALAAAGRTDDARRALDAARRLDPRIR